MLTDIIIYSPKSRLKAEPHDCCKADTVTSSPALFLRLLSRLILQIYLLFLVAKVPIFHKVERERERENLEKIGRLFPARSEDILYNSGLCCSTGPGCSKHG